MKQSSLLHFRSTEFLLIPGEDQETNPGMFGKALALWVASALHNSGIAAGEPFAEDFGWCVPVPSQPHKTFIACCSMEDSEWRLFVSAEGGFVARILGKDRSAETVHKTFALVHRLLSEHPGVHDLQLEHP